VDDQNRLVGQGDLSQQLRQIFHNIDRVLAAAGYDWNDVVATTTYLARDVDVDTYMAARLPFYRRTFSTGNYPTSTLLVVDRLASEGFLVEMQLIAAR
jgi:enamine deaminase RidA (YjgF/YER057c/UK114 family)